MLGLLSRFVELNQRGASYYAKCIFTDLLLYEKAGTTEEVLHPPTTREWRDAIYEDASRAPPLFRDRDLSKSVVDDPAAAAAAWGKRWAGRDAHFGSPITEGLAAAGPIRSRSRYYVANNPWLHAGIEARQSNAIASGIIPRSKHPVPAIRQRLQDDFSLWADTCDADGAPAAAQRSVTRRCRLRRWRWSG